MKLQMLKKKKIALLLSLLMVIGIVIPANALEPSPLPTSTPTASEPETEDEKQDNKREMTALGLESSDLLISEEAAQYIAEFFISDMIKTGQTLWSPNTSVVTVKTLYDETGENPTGYSCELTEGYVIVAAYADMPNPILEWSDRGVPLYKDELLSFERSNCFNEKVIYLGPIDYYIDDGQAQVTTIDGNRISRDDLKEDFSELRCINNLSDKVIENIATVKKGKSLNSDIVTFAGGPNTDDGYITDAFTYAKNVYCSSGKWEATSEWKNYWEDYIGTRAIMDDFQPNGYFNCCVPVAITNAIKMYGRQAKIGFINSMSNAKVFDKVIEANDALTKTEETAIYIKAIGTDFTRADKLIRSSFSLVNGDISVWGPYRASVTNIRNAVGTPERLMVLNLKNHAYYSDPPPGFEESNHVVLGYAYNTIYNAAANIKYRRFLKICDGRSRDSRYVDVSVISNDKYWEIYSNMV